MSPHPQAVPNTRLRRPAGALQTNRGGPRSRASLRDAKLVLSEDVEPSVGEADGEATDGRLHVDDVHRVRRQPVQSKLFVNCLEPHPVTGT